MRFLRNIRRSTVTVAAGLVLAALTAGAPAAAGSAPGWQATEVYPVVHSLIGPGVGVNPAFYGLSCLSAGSCVASGWYARKGQGEFGEDRPMTATESDGRWGTSLRLWLPATKADPDNGAQVTGISCPALGSCAAGGLIGAQNSSARYAFVITESGGRWNRPRRVQLPPDPQASPAISEIDGISCTAPGSCVAVGWYISKAVNYVPIAVTESGGHWHRAVALPAGLRGPNFANLSSVSCPAPGWCVAVGADTYGPGPGRHQAALVTVFSHGRWQRPAPPPGSHGGSLVSVGCRAVGDCVAVGGGGYAVLEHGRWLRGGNAIPVPADGEPDDSFGPNLVTVSCTPSECLAGGYYYSNTRHIFPAFVVSYAARKWRDPVEISLPRNAAPDSGGRVTAISCTTSSCTAVGTYTTKAGLEPDWAAAGPG